MHNQLVAVVLASALASCSASAPRNAAPTSAAQPARVAEPAARSLRAGSIATTPPTPAVDAYAGAPAAQGGASSSANEPLDERWFPTVRAIVAGYESWGRVDDEARWAPYLCRLPFPASARISEAAPSSSHGRKLYFLYAMNPERYGFPASEHSTASPVPQLSGVRQVIVKEAFVPQRSPSGHALSGPGGYRPAQHEGALWGPGDRAGLYVMFQLEPSTQGTDQGWVYATVAADRQTITGAGTMESCMRCHREAPSGRLFGVRRGAGHGLGPH